MTHPRLAGPAYPLPQGGDGAPCNVFSIDVEDYFHVEAFVDFVDRGDWDQYESRVERNTYRLLQLMAEHDVRATMFFLGWVAERCPDLVRASHEQGHEVAVHSWNHERVTTLDQESFREDVRRTKAFLEDLVGAEVIGYRAPTYSIVRDTLWALDVLAEEGYQYDSSIFPIRHDRYGIPDAPRFPWYAVDSEEGSGLVEFPVSTVRLGRANIPFVGGGYLRHFPAAFMYWGMRRVVHGEGKPAMVYVHPWEIDAGQPRLAVGWKTRWRHYGRLASVEGRLRSLFERYRFGTAREVLDL